MAMFTLTWFILFSITYGTNVPSGIFVPGMIIGCSLGQIVSESMKDYELISQDTYIRDRNYLVLLGCTGMLAGYTRMNYSLAVIIMETTHSNDIFVPMMLTIMVSKYVGDLFNSSIYQRAQRTKQLPIITDAIPKET